MDMDIVALQRLVDATIESLFATDHTRYGDTAVEIRKLQHVLASLENGRQLNAQPDDAFLEHMDNGIKLVRKAIEERQTKLNTLIANNGPLNLPKIEPQPQQAEQTQRKVQATSGVLTQEIRQRPAARPVQPSSADAEEDQTKAGGAIRREHDELTLDLVHIARALKNNSRAMQELIRKDQTELGRIDQVMELNSSRFREQQKNLNTFSRSSWASTWRIIVLTILVIISMLATAMVIIVTK